MGLENFNTQSMEGHWKFWVRGGQEAMILKEHLKLKVNNCNNEVLFIAIQNVKNKHQTFFKNKKYEDSITPFL